MVRLIEPSSGQFISHIEGHSVDVHNVGSQMFTNHMKIKGINDW